MAIVSFCELGTRSNYVHFSSLLFQLIILGTILSLAVGLLNRAHFLINLQWSII